MGRSDTYATITTKTTPQNQPDPSRSTEQKRNAAGGFTFTVDAESRVRRFLTLGSDGATYYASADALTRDNAGVIIDYAQTHPNRLVDLIVEISTAGRAPKQQPGLFALAVVAGVADTDGRSYALAALPKVARTASTLFEFVGYALQFRNWGRQLRRAIGSWYTDREAGALAYQMTKYRQRAGWSHQDLLRMAHPVAPSPAHDQLFGWATGHTDGSDSDLDLVRLFVRAQAPDSGLTDWLDGVDRGFSWEMLPDAALSEPAAWERLIDRDMPITALMRQLPRLTRLGVARTRRAQIVAALTDPDRLKRGRVHPINVLVALRTYASGHGARGQQEWTPDRHIVDVLDAAFYAAFDTVQPTGKRTLLALDVSGSMASPVSNLPLSCREASAALALVTDRVEPNCDIVGFTSMGGWGSGSAITELPITSRMRLDDVLRTTERLRFGATDCALPMLWAKKQGREYDTIVILTDNETWYGNVHPHQALAAYRQATGIPTRLAVVAMTATGSTIADPKDPGQMDVSGFDSAVPQLLADFSAGLV